MSVKKYSIKFLRNFELLWPSLIINGLTVLIYIYIIGVTAPLFISFAFFGFFFIVNILPVLILHTQYFRKNNGAKLLIDKINKKLTFQKNGKLLEANFSDIVRLSYYSSYGRGSWYTFGDYEFCKITFSNNKEIFITSLMMRNVKKELEDLLSIKADERLNYLALLPMK